MKRFLTLVFVALLGGLAAIALDHYVLDAIGRDGDISVTIPHRPMHVPSTFVNQQGRASGALPDFTEISEMTVNAVVHIRSEFARRERSQQDMFDQGDLFEFFFGPRSRPSIPQTPAEASGSGVIVGPDGYIITNNHVVANASLIEVTLNDNRIYEAEIIGTDPTTDLAILKIHDVNLPYLVFGDSDDLRVGEWVLAIGNPFNLASTVTAGIVSAKGRNINILAEDMAIESFIQTDAAVNRGNSGGALVNTHGELIGINTAIASTTGTFAGYSFAVPSNIAKKVMEDLLEFGHVQRGLLGIYLTDLSSRRAQDLGLDITQGVVVDSVQVNSAGEEAGLKSGDVITGIEQASIRSASELIENVARRRPGDRIVIRYLRDGREYTTAAVLRNIYGDITAVTSESRDFTELLGARFETVPEAELSQLGLSHGVRVASLNKGALTEAGIRRGFIVTHIAGEEVRTPQQVIRILQDRSGGVLVEGVYSDGRRAYYGVALE